MVSSLKTKHLDSFDLYVGARDFLRIFTDASNHIPRHRRQKCVLHERNDPLLTLPHQLFRAPHGSPWGTNILDSGLHAPGRQGYQPRESPNPGRSTKYAHSPYVVTTPFRPPTAVIRVSSQYIRLKTTHSLLQVLTEVLKECLQLRSQLVTPEDAGSAFLDYPR